MTLKVTSAILKISRPNSGKNSICSSKELRFCVLYDAERDVFAIAKFLIYITAAAKD